MRVFKYNKICIKNIYFMSSVLNTSLPVIKETITFSVFNQLLNVNVGILIFKFGATWCGPCKAIENALNSLFPQMPCNVQSFIIDIDQSSELYSALKNKRVLNGVPAVIAYYSGNTSLYPDDMTIGSDLNQLNLFFQRSYEQAQNMLLP